MGYKVMTAMSGGVDSAAAALLLISAGYYVSGGTMIMHDSPESYSGAEDAAEAAHALGIDHRTYDVRELFVRRVCDYFASEYMAGRTPNPCVRCNMALKIPEFLRLSQNDGFDAIATGHYARREYDSSVGRWILKKGADSAKDQSYFLCMLTQDMLAHTLFPLGGMTKREIKELCADKGLAVSKRPESQDVCFLPDADYKSFIESNYGAVLTEGKFISPDGKELGTHNGALGYTIGQRRGLGVSSADGRLYVLAKDMEKNTVVLGKEDGLFKRCVYVSGVNYVSVPHIADGSTVTAKIRYSRAEAAARVHLTGENSLILEFDEPQRAPCPGQASVIYDGDVLLAGGTIENAI